MKNKLKKIKLLLLDVDGVLTDGQIIYTDKGEQIKNFDSKDGFGIRLLMDNNVKVGIITGRKSNALLHRCKNLGIDIIFDGVKDKTKALDAIIDQTGIDMDEIAFIGDDLLDLPAMNKAGLSIAVADAVIDVKENADIITSKNGGHGAVREVCELILKAKGLWNSILNSYTS